MHTKNSKHPARGGKGTKRERERWGEKGSWTNKLYTIFLPFSFQPDAWFSICFLIFTNLFCALGFEQTQRRHRRRVRMRKLNPGDSLKGSNRSNTTLNHKYFPCQQLISLWFICECEFAFYVYIFIYFIFAPRIQQQQQQLKQSTNGWGCPWAHSTLTPPSVCTPLSSSSLSFWAEVWTCFLLLNHPASFSFFCPHSWVILLNFVQYFHLASFRLLASRFSFFPLFSLSVRFSTIFFSLTKHTIIISILMLQ